MKANILSQMTIPYSAVCCFGLLSGSGPFTSLLFSLSSRSEMSQGSQRNPRKFTWSSLEQERYNKKNMSIKVIISY